MMDDGEDAVDYGATTAAAISDLESSANQAPASAKSAMINASAVDL
jgi:hypothetical protein